MGPRAGGLRSRLLLAMEQGLIGFRFGAGTELEVSTVLCMDTPGTCAEVGVFGSCMRVKILSTWSGFLGGQWSYSGLQS